MERGLWWGGVWFVVEKARRGASSSQWGDHDLGQVVDVRLGLDALAALVDVESGGEVVGLGEADDVGGVRQRKTLQDKVTGGPTSRWIVAVTTWQPHSIPPYPELAGWRGVGPALDAAIIIRLVEIAVNGQTYPTKYGFGGK